MPTILKPPKVKIPIIFLTKKLVKTCTEDHMCKENLHIQSRLNDPVTYMYVSGTTVCQLKSVKPPKHHTK